MKQSNISTITQTYFGDHFYYSGWVLLVTGIPASVIRWYVGALFILLGLLLISSVYKLEIKPSSKTIDDYLFIFGRKINLVSKSFEKLKYVIIKEGKYSQQLNYKSISSVVEGTMYSAYLKADDELYYLGESKNLNRISKKAKILASRMQVDFHPLNNE
jgi:hypothetical protein